MDCRLRQGVTDRILFPGFVAFHHRLQIAVGNHAGSIFIDVLAVLILASNHRARNPCLPINRELHPHAFAKLVLMYTIGTNNNGLPGSFVSGICIGNLDADTFFPGLGYKGFANKTFTELDNQFFTLGGVFLSRLHFLSLLFSVQDRNDLFSQLSGKDESKLQSCCGTRSIHPGWIFFHRY